MLELFEDELVLELSDGELEDEDCELTTLELLFPPPPPQEITSSVIKKQRSLFNRL